MKTLKEFTTCYYHVYASRIRSVWQSSPYLSVYSATDLANTKAPVQDAFNVIVGPIGMYMY